MIVMSYRLRKSAAQSPIRRATARCVTELLEGRRLLSATVVQPLGNITGQPGSTSSAIDLTTSFDDPAVNSMVRFATPLGNIDLQLFDSQKPITVRNFLNYVRSGRYNGTFVHRVTDPATAGIGVVQGGT